VIRVDGLKETVAYLRKVGGPSLAKSIQKAGKEVSTIIADRMQARAPVGSDATRDKHPGRLKSRIKPLATQRVAKVKIGAGLDYAKPIIFGWKKHHIAPHKFPFEVMDQMKTEIPEIYEKAVEAALKEAQV